MAAAGTPDPGTAGNGATTCNTNTAGPTNTGSSGQCQSRVGVLDMVGNVSEWVADWIPAGTACPGWGAGFSDDLMCLAGADAARGPGGLIRGGDWTSATNAGTFALSGFDPSLGDAHIGFRCAR